MSIRRIAANVVALLLIPMVVGVLLCAAFLGVLTRLMRMLVFKIAGDNEELIGWELKNRIVAVIAEHLASREPDGV